MFRRKRRALAVALVCALLGALVVTPVARGQDLIEYALIVGQLALLTQDTTPPTIAITTPPEGATYAPGQHTFTVTATDVAFTVVGGTLVAQPNTATATTRYTVAYPFAGFQRPVDNPPDSN